jgi:hypothetical protein
MKNDEREIGIMFRIRNHFDQAYAGWLLAFTAIVLFVSGCFDSARAQQTVQKTFPSAEEACAALIGAVREQDQLALVQILGPTAQGIISGGDEPEDANSRRQFVEKYREMHRLVRERDGKTTL